MLTLAAFASLAQLGSGLALALTIFVEPISTREKGLRRKIDDALKLVPRDGSEAAMDRENELLLKLFELNDASDKALTEAQEPLTLVKMGAVLNFLVLLACTVLPNCEVDNSTTFVLLMLCIAPVTIGFIWMSRLSRSRFRDCNLV